MRTIRLVGRSFEAMVFFHDFGSLAPILRALVLTTGAVAWTLILARLVGLRAFSKATAFDFAATIATGSLIAQAGTRRDLGDYAQAMAAIAAVFLIQYLLAQGRMMSSRFADAVDNRPTLLVRNGQLLKKAMRKTRVTEATLLEKIRGSNAGSVSNVRAMVLETTGDLSVMTEDDFDPELLEGVRQVH